MIGGDVNGHFGLTQQVYAPYHGWQSLGRKMMIDHILDCAEAQKTVVRYTTISMPGNRYINKQVLWWKRRLKKQDYADLHTFKAFGRHRYLQHFIQLRN